MNLKTPRINKIATGIVVVALLAYLATMGKPKTDVEIRRENISMFADVVDRDILRQERRELEQKMLGCLQKEKLDYCQYLLPISHQIGQPW
jgi:hypothetical protein